MGSNWYSVKSMAKALFASQAPSSTRCLLCARLSLTLTGRSLRCARQSCRLALAFPTISRKVAGEIPRRCAPTKA